MKTKQIEHYHYLESGLEYIYLKKVKVQETPYGMTICLTHVRELHEKIAIGILKHSIPLRGKELKFLRKNLGITQVELSKVLELAQSTLVNWEGKDLDKPIDAAHSYFLQQYFREKYGLAVQTPTVVHKIRKAKEVIKLEL